MGAVQNHHVGMHRGKKLVGSVWTYPYSIGAAEGSGDTPAHAWADFTPDRASVADAIAAGDVALWVKFMTFLAAVDITAPHGGDTVREYIKYIFGEPCWTAIMALQDPAGLLDLLKQKADAGLVTP